MTYKFSKHKFDSLKLLSSKVYDERILSNWQYVLRELPNGVKDEVRVSEKKTIIRANKKALEVSDIFDMYTAYSNLDYARIKKPVDSIMYNNTTQLLSAILDGYTEFTGVTFDSTDNINKYSLKAHSTDIWLGFAKGTTLAQVKTVLTGLTLTYQLAEPIVTPLPDDLDPQTYELARQSELLDKAINAIIVLGGSIV